MKIFCEKNGWDRLRGDGRRGAMEGGIEGVMRTGILTHHYFAVLIIDKMTQLAFPPPV